MGKLNFKNVFTILVFFSLLFASLPIKIFAEEIKSGISTNSSEEIETKIPVKNADATNIKTGPTSSIEPKVGEIVEDRTVNTKTYYNGNGKYTKKIYFEPVNMKEPGEKTLEEISPNLVKDESTKNIITTENTAIDTDFLKSMSNGKYANFTYKGHSMSLSILQVAGENKQTLLADDVEATFEESSNKIVHKGIFPQIDLQNYTFNQNTKEDLVLHQYNGYHIFKFKIQTDLKATIDDVGNIQMKDENDKKVFELPKPNMSDSNYDKGSGDSATSNKVKYDIQETEDGYILTLNADPDWLASSERVFPIYIDPTTSVTNSSDSFVMSAYPTTNYSSTSSKWDSGLGEYILKIGNYDSTTGTCYAFINQSLPNLAGVTVTSANFNAYVTHTASASATGIWLDRITESWSNSTVTWNTKPDSVNLTSDTVGKDQWASFDITGTVKSWQQGTQKNYGLKLHTNGNGQSYWKKIVSTSNSNNNPYISVNYSIPVPPKPEVTKVISNGNQTGYINLDWDPIPGATGYNVWIYNGKEYEKFPVGTATSFTTQNKGIWPTEPNATKTLNPILDLYHTAGTGGQELPTEPAYLYKASGGAYPTTNHYWFRISAIYPLGESVMSNPSTPTIPDLAKPAKTTSKSYTFGDQTGYFDISWSKVTGATGYKVWFFNGKEYEQVYDTKSDVNSYSTRDLKVWPKPTETGRYKLHLDNTGASFASNPSVVYTNAAGGYEDRTYYYIKISAYNEDGESLQSDAEIKYISSLTTPTPPNGDVYANELNSDFGYANLAWDPIPGAAGYKVWVFNGKFYESYDVKNTTSWTTKGKGIWPTDAEIANANPTKTQILHQDGKGTDLPREPFKLYSKMGTTYATSLKFYFKVSAYDSKGETVYSPTYLGETMSIEPDLSHIERLGLEDYWTYNSHVLGDGQAWINVTNGNIVAVFGDSSLYTRGTLNYRFDRTYNSQSTDVSPIGKGWTFAGNESLNEVKDNTKKLTRVVYIDEDGTKHVFLYDSIKSEYLSPKGKYFTLKQITINGNNGYELIDKSGLKKQFETIASDSGKYRIFSYIDKFNNKIGFIYDSKNRIVKISEMNSDGTPIRNTINFTYSGTSNLISTAQFVDKKFTYTYNNDQTLKEVIISDERNIPRVIKNEFTYDSSGLLQSFIDQKGLETDFSHNLASLDVTEQIDGETVTTSYDYANEDTYKLSDSNGNKTVYTRDTSKNTYAIANIETDTTTSIVFDNNYNILNKDENGEISTYAYDNKGNQLTSMDPDGSLKTNKYDSYNNLLTSKVDTKDENGDQISSTTTNTYDSSNNWLKTVTDSNGTTTYDVDKYGRNLTITNPDGTKTTNVYDDSLNTVTLIDENNQQTITSYDENGSIIWTTDPNGNKTLYSYDLFNPTQINSLTQPEGDKTTYTYDINGNISNYTDALGRTKNYLFADSGKIKEYKFPISDQKSMTYKYEYNDQGNLTKYISNSKIEKRISYNDNEKVSSVDIYKDNIKQIGWNYAYNEDNLLSSIQYGSFKKEYTYNENNELQNFTQGSFKEMFDSTTDGIDSYTVTYSDSTVPYSKNTKVSTTDNSIETNVNNQVILNETTDEPSMSKVISVNDKVSKKLQMNKLENTKELTISKFGTVQNTNYSYDPNGNMLSEKKGSSNTSFKYDKNQELIQETLSDGTVINYEYDRVGNRIKKELIKSGNVISSDTLTYNDGNQITSKNGVSNQFVYDDDGSLLSDGSYNYTYNLLGQLTRVKKVSGETVATYEYDEENQRTKKIIGNKQFEYYYENAKLTLEVIKVNGVVTDYHTYVYDSDGIPVNLIWQHKNSSNVWSDSVYYYITNIRGDVTSLLDEKGQEVALYTYDAFGNILDSSGTLKDENPLRYAGYYYDKEVKLYYLNARYYNSDLGSFITYDPAIPGDIYDPLSQNGYNYANNNPVDFIDPNGEAASKTSGKSTKTKTLNQQLFALARDSYSDTSVGSSINSGWKVLYDAKRNRGKYAKSSGFSATVYYKKLSSNNKFDYAIAYRGTQLKDGVKEAKKDITDDIIDVGLGLKNTQSLQAIKIANDVIKEQNKKINKFYFTGHSLGGYLAALEESELVDKNASFYKKTLTLTYNAPGISTAIYDKTWGYFGTEMKEKANNKSKYNKYIINYMIKGDPISQLGTSLGTIAMMKSKNKCSGMSCHGVKRFQEIGF